MKTTALAALACTAIICSAPTVNAQNQPQDAPATLTARFTDGWMAPYFSLTTDNQRTWDVEARMEQDGSKLRVINPYGSAGFKLAAGESNATTEPHDIVFDISDPDFVRVELNAAYTSPEGVFGTGVQTIWAQGRADYLIATGRTPEVITQNALNSTFDGTTLTVPQAVLGFTSNPLQCGETWNAGAFATRVELKQSAVGTIPTDDTIQPDGATGPEYFNLQGIPVSHPESGNLYIGRSGHNARLVKM